MVIALYFDFDETPELKLFPEEITFDILHIDRVVPVAELGYGYLDFNNTLKSLIRLTSKQHQASTSQYSHRRSGIQSGRALTTSF